MKFVYKLIEELPALAWLAQFKKNTDEILVVHGPKVECHSEFFVSGVWEGEFSKGGFSTAVAFQGTGIQLINRGGWY